MESPLTSTAEILVIGFALLMALDFFSGLVHLYRSAPTQTIARSELETQSAMPQGYALMSITPEPKPKQEPQPQPLSLVTTGWDAIEEEGMRPATLNWLETAIKLDILDATETPNVIEMVRVRQIKAQVLSGGQPERDLTELSIRELKKRASVAKIKRYNVMTKNQLIDQLAALGQLSA